jgi:hypothetical protein
MLISPLERGECSEGFGPEVMLRRKKKNYFSFLLLSVEEEGGPHVRVAVWLRGTVGWGMT